MLEHHVESKLRAEIIKLGGKCLKFTSPGTSGVFDRLIIMPHNDVWFVELKRPGGTLDPLQEVFLRDMQLLGTNITIIENYDEVNAFIKLLRLRQNNFLSSNK